MTPDSQDVLTIVLRNRFGVMKFNEKSMARELFYHLLRSQKI